MRNKNGSMVVRGAITIIYWQTVVRRYVSDDETVHADVELKFVWRHVREINLVEVIGRHVVFKKEEASEESSTSS